MAKSHHQQTIKEPSTEIERMEEINKNINNNYSKEGTYKCFLGEFQTQLYWGNIFWLLTAHLAAIYFLYYLSKFHHDPIFLLIYSFVFINVSAFGITAGAHRYFTHRTFKAKIPLQIILLISYSLAGQNNLLDWVRDHRVHHKFSETDGDPHNSNRGFFFAHVGWLCMKKRPEVIENGKKIDLSDLHNDKTAQFMINHWMPLKMLFCFILPVLIPSLIFNIPWSQSFAMNWIRYILSLNATWCINSVAHLWGMRPFNKHIQPVESWFSSIVALGEGYHNFHHTFPCDYRASEMGTKLNMTTFWLNLLSQIGWAYDLKTTNKELVEKCIMHTGDGSRKVAKSVL